MLLLWLVALGAFTFSVFSAAFVDYLLDGRIAILGSFIGLERSLNPGIAFGLALPSLLQSFLILLALVVVLAMAARSTQTLLEQMGFGLVIGGGLANIIDRISDGLVTDFIQVGSFPVFNVADSCITIGVAILLAGILWPKSYRGK